MSTAPTPRAVSGDRFCTRCGYNLVAQPIVREERYEMLIVRCPECGAVAAIEQYPMLERWARRWAALSSGATRSGCALASRAAIMERSSMLAPDRQGGHGVA